MNFYQEGQSAIWQGRDDKQGQERVFQAIKAMSFDRLASSNIGDNAIGLLGFACDEGVSRNLGRRGAALGPDAIRSVLAPLCLQTRYKRSFIDLGTVSCPNQDLESAQAVLGEKVALMLDHKIHPIVLGGGHETAWAHFLGIKDHLKGKRWGIINFDAHFDLRPNLPSNKGSSGTPFQQIATYCKETNRPFNYLCLGIQKHANPQHLFDKAKELGVEHVMAEQFHLGEMDHILGKIERFISELDHIYLSICLDVFSSSLCPGVSAPQARGIEYGHFILPFKSILNSGKILSADIVELAPPFDVKLQSSKFAASIVLDLLQEARFAI